MYFWKPKWASDWGKLCTCHWLAHAENSLGQKGIVQTLLLSSVLWSPMKLWTTAIDIFSAFPNTCIWELNLLALSFPLSFVKNNKQLFSALVLNSQISNILYELCHLDVSDNEPERSVVYIKISRNIWGGWIWLILNLRLMVPPSCQTR